MVKERSDARGCGRLRVERSFVKSQRCGSKPCGAVDGDKGVCACVRDASQMAVFGTVDS